jgi:hypothetical protein
MGLMIGSVDCTGPQVWAVESTESEVGIGPKAGTWMGGGGIGFLGNTPDGTAFALNLNADGFLNRNLSLGPLLQLGLTGDMTLVGLSGQAKYWIDLPETSNRAKLFVEGGIGFAHADLRGSDTSWLIPLGVGLDYRVDRKISLTTTFLLNFTDLDLGRGNSTTVMPGLTFGLRF